MPAENIFFILVRPNFLGNIGSVARAMKNFGFENLRLVDPPQNYKEGEAKFMAVGAYDLLERSQVYENLGDALKDINIAIGTSSGRQREHPPAAIDQILSRVSLTGGNRIAMIFGSERDGLSRDEVDRCHHIVTIPTNESFPTLNIAQAVGVCAYELSKGTAASSEQSPVYTNGAEDDEFLADVDALLQDIQFMRTFNRDSINTELRTLYQKAQPTIREMDLLKSVLRKINQRLKQSKVI